MNRINTEDAECTFVPLQSNRKTVAAIKDAAGPVVVVIAAQTPAEWTQLFERARHLPGIDGVALDCAALGDEEPAAVIGRFRQLRRLSVPVDLLGYDGPDVKGARNAYASADAA